MSPDRGRVAIAIVGAVVAFCVVAVAAYYRIAGVAMHGWMQSGPVALTGAMAGLFAGGLAAVVALILLLRRR